MAYGKYKLTIPLFRCFIFNILYGSLLNELAHIFAVKDANMIISKAIQG